MDATLAKLWFERARADVRAGWSRRWFRWISYAAGLLIVAWAVIWFGVARALPDASQLLSYEPQLPTNVRGLDGAPIHSYVRERRVEIAFDEIPKPVLAAFLSAEDKNFFKHGGVDYFGVVRAAFNNITSDGRAQGASTITQQLAKNLLVGNERSYVRKAKEALLAYRIEHVLTKQQILELYLNQIPLGRTSFGVQAASRAYFDKDLGELSLSQAAFLATLPKAPETYGRAKFAGRALGRRNYVLNEMLANGYINQLQHDAAMAQPLGILPRIVRRQSDATGYFVEEVRRSLIAKYGETAEAGPNSVYAGGLWVRTSFDPRLQTYAQEALRDGLLRYARGQGWAGPVGHVEADDRTLSRFIGANVGIAYDDWRTAVVLSKNGGAAQLGLQNGQTGTLPASSARAPRKGTGTPAFNVLKAGDIIAVAPEGDHFALRSVPEIAGAFVVQNPHTGQVLAMQGGFDSRLAAFNRATQAQRQPGSSFKPVVYSAALDHGFTPATLIVDGPFCVYQGANLGNKCFRNFGNMRGAGPQTMRWGVEQSRNLMTVRAASQTGMQAVVQRAADLGISPPGKPYPPYLSIALGAGETTVLKMVNAYSILANNGRALRPTLVDYVQDRHGKTIYRADTRPCDRCNMPDWDGKAMPRPPVRRKQVLDPMTAYQMVHIMEGVVERGTATVLRDLKRPLFGKTGTTSGPTNVWFVGGSPDLVGGLYLGYDVPRSMGGYAQGGTIAAPVFRQFAAQAMKDMPPVPFRAAGGVRMVRIDRRSGQRVYGTFPLDDSDPKAAVIWEAFKPESEPRRSVRREDLPKVAAKQAKAAAAAETGRDDDFLQRQGGIY